MATTTSSTPPTTRLASVDALRGFALLAIVLLHNLEHYNLFGNPTWQPEWLTTFDGFVHQTIFFLLAGKAYATFSLLFGFSFYIQMRNARERGYDFRRRFAWRMLLLFGFSQLHALFYNGDILLLYAVCGLILIPASSWSNRTVAIVAAILMFQPYAWGKIIYALANPEDFDNNSLFITYARSAEEVGRNGNLLQTLANNIWNGQLYSNFWQVEAGRLFQTPSLFLLGMLAGRMKLFVRSLASIRFWRNTLIVGGIMTVISYLCVTIITPLISNVTILSYYSIAAGMLYNFWFMVVLVSIFMLVWWRFGDGSRFQRSIIPYGRMSLTNYICQSIIGVMIYYNCGCALYDHVGATLSVAIGFGIFLLQLYFSRIWLSTHKQGPLESIWKRLTWISSFPQPNPTL